MIPYRLDYTIEKLTRSGPSVERTLLRIYTGDELSESDARSLWQRIADHKWYVSEQLSRDVGFHVAAVDYVENFYRTEPARPGGAKTSALARKFLNKFNKILTSYFVARGKAVSL